MNIQNIRIGACFVTFKGKDLGHTKEGVEFEFEREFEDLIVDQYGSTPVDMALTGQNLKVKVALAEPNTYNLSVAIPEGEYESGATDDRLNLGEDAGYQLRGDAGLLVLHPLKNASTNLSEDINVYKAVSVEKISLGYKVDEQRVIEITFRALIDETYGAGRRLGHIGPSLIS